MPHTKIPKIELKADDSIALTVEVLGFEAGTPIEISGNATQENGAIATFHDIQNLPPASPDASSLVTVVAVPSPKFVAGEVITVVGRVAMTWGTVLSEDPEDQRLGIKAAWKAKPETGVT